MRSVIIMIALLSCCSAAGVLLNEVELGPPEGSSEWVELYNPGNESVVIGGWCVRIIDESWIGEIRLPDNALIEPHGFYVALGRKEWMHNSSGVVQLIDDTGNVVDESPLRRDTLKNEMTWGRYPDGRDTDTAGDWGYMMGTMGAPNTISAKA
ncbi:MAG: lamin tail domain-containing protein [Methanothrix sp.]|jgi:hypothetical protein|uniref:lamin tail domain-containing protein n=1 Tax=Methanothrix sp. TaxID=90426 RepID=UPI00247B9B48|nr:lamin tail domain-containing protein [Methanothrix sp.]